MPCGFTEAELYIIFKISLYNRWCDKHINVESLTGGIPSNKKGLYRDAVKSLVRKGYFKAYNSQGRIDVCALKQHRAFIIQSLHGHRKEYSFLDRFDEARIR